MFIFNTFLKIFIIKQLYNNIYKSQCKDRFNYSTKINISSFLYYNFSPLISFLFAARTENSKKG